MTRRHKVERALFVGASALVLGAVDSLIKGEGTGLLGALSKTVAPWLLLAFLAGALTSDRRFVLGALTGLEATILALVGFYFINSLIFPIGADGWIMDFRIALHTGKVYFELAILSGPLFGAFGAWWRQRLSVIPVITLGMIFVVEAIEQASHPNFFVQYADQVAVIEIVLGVTWTVFALSTTKALRERAGSRSTL